MKCFQWIVALAFSLILIGGARADLVGLYRFDADVDPQPDSTTNDNSAALMGAAWVDDADRGGSMSFGGDGDHLVAQDSDSLSVVGDMTIAAWARFGQFDSWNAIVSKTGDVEMNKPGPYDLYTSNNGGGLVTMYIGNGSDSLDNVSATTASALNEWEHIAVTITADGSITHYLNGELNGEGMVDVTREDRDMPLLIGTRADGVTNMNGLLDDVAIFNETLSQDDIKTIMTGDFTAYGIPEPTGMSLLLIGAASLAFARRRRS